MMKHLKWIVALGLLGALLPVARAEDETLLSIAKGDKVPLTLAPADIPDDALAFKIVTIGQDTEMLGGLMGMGMAMAMSVGSSGGNNQSFMTLMAMNDVVWTQGKTLTMGGEEYLIGYRLDAGVSPILAAASATKQDWVLRLDLVKKSAIASISPRTDLKKADLQALIANLGKSSGSVDQPRASVPPPPVDAKTLTISNAKQIALGVIMYSADYDDILPYPQSTKAVQMVVNPYVRSAESWKTCNPQGGQLAFNMAIGGVALSDIPKPAMTPLFYDTLAWPDGSRIVAFCDGHVASVTPQEWDKLTPYRKLKLKRHGKPLPLDYGKEFKAPSESS